MTQKEAKELTLEVWRYLMRHPSLPEKRDLPYRIFEKIRDLRNTCPLCVLFYSPFISISGCSQCPLKSCERGSIYHKWNTGDWLQRAINARKIVSVVKAWRPKEE
jgi:hypothetical protein